MHDAIMARVARLRGETTPYLSRPEARALVPTLDAGAAAGDPWALWVRGRVADDHLLDDDPTDAETLWTQGDTAGHPGCSYELGRRAERALQTETACARYGRSASGGFAPAALRLGLLRLRQSASEAWRLPAEDCEALRAEARAACTRAAEMGYAVAWDDVGLVLRSRFDVPEEDDAESQRCLQRAAAAPAAQQLGHCLEGLRGQDDVAPVPREVEVLRRWIAEAGEDGLVCWVHARLIERGDLPGPRAHVEALWQAGAELGDPRCRYALALSQERRSKKTARALYEQAAGQGHGLAAMRLGQMATKWPEAERWHRRAIALGRSEAWLQLAKGYSTGAQGATVDREEAFQCWERAAEAGAQGPAAAMAEAYTTGQCDGLPLARDPDKARRFAALGMNLGEGGGSPACQLVMAKLYAAGEGGLARDPEAAALWSRIAARPGDRVEAEARAMYDTLWSGLDAEARARVDARDRSLRHP